MSHLELLSTWQPTVIKGNAGEIAALLNSTEVSTRGVDAGRGQAFKDPAQIVRDLARKERCVVVMTGETDWIADEQGKVVVRIDNGHELVRSFNKQTNKNKKKNLQTHSKSDPTREFRPGSVLFSFLLLSPCSFSFSWPLITWAE